MFRLIVAYGNKHVAYEKLKTVFVNPAARHFEQVRKHIYNPRTQAVLARSALFFTSHPAQTEETYGQHLWFTVKMSLHFVTVSLLLFTHGVFPFLFTRTASRQIEKIYLIMRSRIPKSRRDMLEGEYDI